MKDFVIKTSTGVRHFNSYIANHGLFCKRHDGALSQGQIYDAICNRGYTLPGRFVTIAVKARSPPVSMTICEVHVYAIPVVGMYVEALRRIAYVHEVLPLLGCVCIFEIIVL